jgi:hypothetical protein
MSLDIYANLKRGTIPSGQQLGTGYRTWSREERDKLTEPTKEVLWINITHNLGKMAHHVPISWIKPKITKTILKDIIIESEDKENYDTYSTTLYHLMWRPEEVFVNKKEIELRDMTTPLEIGLKYLLSHEKQLSKYNPENGWGHYENFVYCLPQYIRACYKWPNAVLEISR